MMRLPFVHVAQSQNVVLSSASSQYINYIFIAFDSSHWQAVDSLINFETVKYYGAEKFEVRRYDESLTKKLDRQYTSQVALQMLNSVQAVIVNLGLLAGCLLCASYIARGDLSVGDFVLFSTYVVQLYAPLNFLGTYYRMIQQSFIDMENMLDLMCEKAEVTDADNCSQMCIVDGEIVFDDVSFYYVPEKQILKSISFRVAAGSTVAVVGPSGSGKSTLIRLLFRFYDVQSGVISIDGQDISQVSQESLRRNIGVVPQDTVLFNDTIRFVFLHYRQDKQMEWRPKSITITMIKITMGPSCPVVFENRWFLDKKIVLLRFFLVWKNCRIFEI